MATGFKIYLPSGRCLTAKAEAPEQQLQYASHVQSGWEDYCERNWLNDDGEDLFSPELRVKRFLDSIGYYLLYGQMDDIVTNYKDAVNTAREIPVSSCPSEVSNIMYASGGSAAGKEEQLSFRAMTSILDDRAPQRKKPPRVDRPVSRLKKIQQIRDEHGGEEIRRYHVDRDGCFWVGKNQFAICGYDKYNAKVVTRRNGETDILFDMDAILQCGDDWYDQNGDRIPDECVHPIGGIVDYDGWYGADVRQLADGLNAGRE